MSEISISQVLTTFLNALQRWDRTDGALDGSNFTGYQQAQSNRESFGRSIFAADNADGKIDGNIFTNEARENQELMSAYESYVNAANNGNQEEIKESRDKFIDLMFVEDSKDGQIGNLDMINAGSLLIGMISDVFKGSFSAEDLLRIIGGFDKKDDNSVNASVFSNNSLEAYINALNGFRANQSGITDSATLNDYRNYLGGQGIDPRFMYSTMNPMLTGGVDPFSLAPGLAGAQDPLYIDDIFTIPDMPPPGVFNGPSSFINGANFGQLSSTPDMTVMGPAGSIIKEGVSAPITSNFGMRTHPVYGDKRMHSGVDIGLPQGTELFAPHNAVVKFAGEQNGYGGLVILDIGGGKELRFAHLSEIKVEEGQTIEAGTLIALSGGARGTQGAGTSTGPHLHFEYRENGVAKNPLDYGYFTQS